MGELTDKVGRDDTARLAHMKREGWGKPINMMCPEHKTATDAYKKGWDQIKWGNKKKSS